MLKGFKEFIMRGNVIDLAVAVVIGAAFTSIVNSLVNGIFNPAIGALFNAESLATAFVVEIPSATGEPAKLMFGAFIAAAIQFVIVAAVVYFVLVMPINHLRKVAEAKRKAGVSAEEVAPPSELAILMEIRDLLSGQSAVTPSSIASGPDATGDGKHVAP